jgi:hypothetical protein
MILIDGNPLEDITILQDHDKLHCIMKDGRFHKQQGGEPSWGGGTGRKWRLPLN